MIGSHKHVKLGPIMTFSFCGSLHLKEILDKYCIPYLNSFQIAVIQKELEAVNASKSLLEQEKTSLELQLKDVQDENSQLKAQLATASITGTNAGAVAGCTKCEDLQVWHMVWRLTVQTLLLCL